jgi:ribulose bisphosphate carboxylase small subunit
MAFQTGTQIRPELGNADFSGFANAASIRANALANLGEQIGEGIEKYQKNKEITAAGLASLEGTTAANPDLLLAFQGDTGDAGKAYKKIESGDFNRKDVLIANGFASSYVNQQQQNLANKIRLSQLNTAETQAGTAALRAETAAGEFEASQNQVPQGRPVTQEQLNELSRTATVDAVPLPDGTYRVERVTAKPPTATAGGSAPVGKEVTMEEVDALVEQGYKPNVEFNAEGKTIITGFGTFAPRDADVGLTSGQDKLLEEMAKSLSPWYTGGRQQAEANLNTYDSIVNKLISGEVTTRNISDLTPEALGISDLFRQVVNPSGQEAVDRVRQIVFQGLKDTLGAQFTQREAERLVSASYNPALDEATNVARLKDARNVLADVINAKNAFAHHIASGGGPASFEGLMPSEVLSSGVKNIESMYYSEAGGLTGFQAPSGIVIKEKK